MKKSIDYPEGNVKKIDLVYMAGALASVVKLANREIEVINDFNNYVEYFNTNKKIEFQKTAFLNKLYSIQAIARDIQNTIDYMENSITRITIIKEKENGSQY